MRSSILRRRVATAAGIYGAALLGFAGQIFAARALVPVDYGRLALALAAAGFFQILLDLTVEEASIKYGFRYVTAEDWGRLRRLLARAAAFKCIGAVTASAALAALAPAGDALFGSGMTVPLLVAALLPIAQAPEGLASVPIILRSRYDVRSALLAFAMGLRTVGIAVGAQYGVAEAMAGIVAGQIAASAAISLVGLIAYRRFPSAPPAALGDDRRDVIRFMLQSSLASGIVSLRGALVPVLLGLVANFRQVSHFRVAQAPSQALASLSAPVRLILLTEQTREWERGREEAVFAGVRRYTVIGAALMAVALPPLIVFMPDLIRIFYTAKYVGATDAARIVLAAAALQLVVGWTKSLPVSIGRPDLRILTHGIETVVLVPLVVALGAAWGAEGAAAAMLVATAVFALVWGVLVVRLRRERFPAAGAAPL